VRSSSDTIVATFNETIDASSLPTSFTGQTFTLTNAYAIGAGDRILIGYSGPARLEICVDYGPDRRQQYPQDNVP
jgi:hypothetical protein